MSSWVAPSVAAEMWGCSVDQVVAAAAEGTVVSMWDGDFLFVAADPSGMPTKKPLTFKPREADPTEVTDILREIAGELAAEDETVVTAEEIAALDEEIEDEQVVEEEPLIVEEPGGPDMRQWKSMRAATAKLRWPPKAAV